MAHAIEGRVPFLDLSMIRLGQLVPPELKLAGSPVIEKWILRKAFEDLLPPEIVWRTKEQFDEGSGTVDLLERLVAESMAQEDFHQYSSRYPEAKLRSAEECHYHRLFLGAYANPAAVLANVARWAERPV
jgi:asparagine synthase (glutamine-hydrolysing)